MTDKKKHLYYLDELSDYKISDGYPDIRGWSVKDRDNRVIGKVDNLLVSLDAERVVYIDVEVDNTIIDANHDPYGRPEHIDVREFVNKDGENHIIVPIGLVDFNEDQKFVFTETVNHRTFAETKRFSKGSNLGRDYEVQVLDSYGRTAEQNADDDSTIFISETRIREIVREEINKLHAENRYKNADGTRTYDLDNDGDADLILTDEETDFHKDVRREGYNQSLDKSKYIKEDRKYDLDGDGNTDIILTEEEIELEKKRRNNIVDDDDRFYQRREFDDQRFRKKRSPKS